MPATGRFAPSPTGILHLGNLRTALASWLAARSRGGRWLIRVEDVDRARCREEIAQMQLADLAALGMESDEPPLRQSQRSSFYQQALQALFQQNLLYPCHCTRKDLATLAQAPHASDGLRPYPGTCRLRPLPALIPAALRFKLPSTPLAWEDQLLGPQQDHPSTLTGDPLLHRRDGCFAYHLAVVVDDGDQHVDEVLRGNDLRDVTATQIRLQEALGLPRPRYAHLGLVTAPDGSRLSKRDGAWGLAALQARGPQTEAILGWLGWSLGCLDKAEPCRLEDLLPRFQIQRIPPGNVPVPEAWWPTT